MIRVDLEGAISAVSERERRTGDVGGAEGVLRTSIPAGICRDAVSTSAACCYALKYGGRLLFCIVEEGSAVANPMKFRTPLPLASRPTLEGSPLGLR